MDTKRFIKESPVGLGWVMGHLTLDEAVRETARLRNVSVTVIREDYQITKEEM